MLTMHCRNLPSILQEKHGEETHLSVYTDDSLLCLNCPMNAKRDYANPPKFLRGEFQDIANLRM